MGAGRRTPGQRANGGGGTVTWDQIATDRSPLAELADSDLRLQVLDDSEYVKHLDRSVPERRGVAERSARAVIAALEADQAANRDDAYALVWSLVGGGPISGGDADYLGGRLRAFAAAIPTLCRQASQAASAAARRPAVPGTRRASAEQLVGRALAAAIAYVAEMYKAAANVAAAREWRRHLRTVWRM